MGNVGYRGWMGLGYLGYGGWDLTNKVWLKIIYGAVKKLVDHFKE